MKRIMFGLSVVVISCLFACGSNVDSVNKANFTIEPTADTTTFYLPNEFGDKYYLDIIHSESPRYLDLEIRQDENIMSSIGYSNLSLVIEKGLPKIDTVDFNADGQSEYIVYSYVEGSTYGADVNFIVYHGINTMELIRIPFERCKISYIDEFQDYIITSFEVDETETLYRFDRGIFLRQ